MYTYFVFRKFPNMVAVAAIFRDFDEARAFVKGDERWYTIRKLPLTDWNFGPLPEYNDTEAIG
jgi:hypothetical protein